MRRTIQRDSAAHGARLFRFGVINLDARRNPNRVKCISDRFPRGGSDTASKLTDLMDQGLPALPGSNATQASNYAVSMSPSLYNGKLSQMPQPRF